MESSFSELTMVRGQYEVYLEEHLGVPNRNFTVGLGGFKPLLIEQYRDIFLYWMSEYFTKQGGTAEVNLSPLHMGRRVFLIWKKLYIL